MKNIKAEPGTRFWRNTINGKILHIGEFLKEKTPPEETLRSWGNELYDCASDLIEWEATHKSENGQTLSHYETEMIDSIFNSLKYYAMNNTNDELEIKSFMLDKMRSYRWHIIDKAMSIANNAAQTANLENII